MSPKSAAANKTRAEVAALLDGQFSRLTRQLRNLRGPQGMTPERLGVLSVVERRGPICVTALAREELVRPATMSRMVSALVNEGLVKREPDKRDARGVLLSATPRGRRARREARDHRLRQLAHALGLLSSQQFAAMQSLTAALARLTNLLDE